jgi:hypothetical protein
MKCVLVMLTLSIAACSPSEEQSAANSAAAADGNEAAVSPSTAAPAAAAVPSLEGEWVVDQLNGSPPNQTWPMTVDATKDRLTIVSECHRFSYAMEQKDNIVKFTQSPHVGCGRFRSPAEFIAEKAVKLGNIAVFSDGGRSVQLNGPGGTMNMSRR